MEGNSLSALRVPAKLARDNREEFPSSTQSKAKYEYGNVAMQTDSEIPYQFHKFGQHIPVQPRTKASLTHEHGGSGYSSPIALLIELTPLSARSE